MNHTEEQERIKAQSIPEWIAEYSGEPIKQEVNNDEIDDNYGVEY